MAISKIGKTVIANWEQAPIGNTLGVNPLLKGIGKGIKNIFDGRPAITKAMDVVNNVHDAGV